jgi:hypothetical protein
MWFCTEITCQSKTWAIFEDQSFETMCGFAHARRNLALGPREESCVCVCVSRRNAMKSAATGLGLGVRTTFLAERLMSSRWPKRMIFGQPIPELRQQQPKEGPDLPAGPWPGVTNEASPGQPPPGSAP